MDQDQIDPGRQKVTGMKRQLGSFKTPGLRDISRTSSYMHDGSLATLEAVIEFYDRGGNRNEQLDEEIFTLQLSASEKADLATFLREGLTSGTYPQPDQ